MVFFVIGWAIWIRDEIYSGAVQLTPTPIISSASSKMVTASLKSSPLLKWIPSLQLKLIQACFEECFSRSFFIATASSIQGMVSKAKISAKS